MDLELVGIEDDVVPALLVTDIEINCNYSLILEASAEFDIVKGEEVVRRLSPVFTVSR